MAIEFEYANLIVPIRAIEARYPGGLPAYQDDCPNNSYLQDDYLTRVGFMSTDEADRYLDQLAARGLLVTGDPNSSDALILDGSQGSNTRYHWLAIGEHDGSRACWLSQSPPGELVGLRHNPIYRGSAQALKDLPRILRDARFSCRPMGTREDRLVCEREGLRIDVEVLGSENPDEDGFLFLIAQHGRIAGAPDDAGLIREVDSLLTSHGFSEQSAG